MGSNEARGAVTSTTAIIGDVAHPHSGSMEQFVPDAESAGSAAVGANIRPTVELLAHLNVDVMTLHTREAYWMFSGRHWSKDRRRILGGQRAAAVVNELRHISVGGNPYADWFLISFEKQLDGLRANLQRIVEEYQRRIESLKNKGLDLHILGSRRPLQLEFAFGSAYGYAIAEAMVEYDHFVRILKTLVLKNRITADEGRRELRRVGRPFRRLFVRVLLWERALKGSPLRDIRRQDYLDFSDEATQQRVAAAIERFGPIPETILARSIVPRHFAHRSGGLGEDVLTVRATARASDESTLAGSLL